MANELVTSFLGALQASLSVLLVIFYGVLAAQFNLIENSATKQISAVCVKLFLPALLVTNVGSQLNPDTAIRYVPILVWGIFYVLATMLVGFIMTRVFKLPAWTTPAVTFNNTSAIPLILIESLATTGILDSLIISSSDSPSAALQRARSYFLVNATIGDSFTFAMGPRLLDGEEAPDKKPSKDNPNVGNEPYQTDGAADGEDEHAQQDHNEHANEQTSLLPSHVQRGEEAIASFSKRKGGKVWSFLPLRVQGLLKFSYLFVHAPLLGAGTGLIVGLVSPLHTAFFGDPNHGGIFTAWLTDSLSKIGELFPALQVAVVGVKLSSSMRKMKRGEDGGQVPWTPMTFVLLMRYVIWPIISIALVYLFASRTNLLGSDPILWFTMMLMPTGPTAMKLTSLADVSGSSEAEKMSIAKFLSISYAISPVICFTVAVALKACHSIMGVS